MAWHPREATARQPRRHLHRSTGSSDTPERSAKRPRHPVAVASADASARAAPAEATSAVCATPVRSPQQHAWVVDATVRASDAGRYPAAGVASSEDEATSARRRRSRCPTEASRSGLVAERHRAHAASAPLHVALAVAPRDAARRAPARAPRAVRACSPRRDPRTQRARARRLPVRREGCCPGAPTRARPQATAAVLSCPTCAAAQHRAVATGHPSAVHCGRGEAAVAAGDDRTRHTLRDRPDSPPSRTGRTSRR